MDGVGRIAPPQLPRLMVIDPAPTRTAASGLERATAQVPSTRQMEMGIGTTTALDGRVR